MGKSGSYRLDISLFSRPAPKEPGHSLPMRERTERVTFHSREKTLRHRIGVIDHSDLLHVDPNLAAPCECIQGKTAGMRQIKLHVDRYAGPARDQSGFAVRSVGEPEIFGIVPYIKAEDRPE